MYKQLFLSAALFAASLQANAQSTATDYKGGNNNPISASVFCADPTALEYNGHLYVYGTNDHQEFIKNGKKGDNSYGSIKSLVVFSTADMVNWTFHGTIDAQKLCATWTGNPWYKGFMNSWAPSVTWRTNPDTGKDEFFLYFANTSHGVGVLTADSPTGPWKSPLKESLINKDTPGALQQSANFDPGVVIDDNGTGWLTFGGLDPDKGGTNFMPNNTRIIKLQPSMTATDGEAILIPAPYHFETGAATKPSGTPTPASITSVPHNRMWARCAIWFPTIPPIPTLGSTKTSMVPTPARQATTTPTCISSRATTITSTTPVPCSRR